LPKKTEWIKEELKKEKNSKTTAHWKKTLSKCHHICVWFGGKVNYFPPA
jgi:hypothetical protein